jgi:hypothetical protein
VSLALRTLASTSAVSISNRAMHATTYDITIAGDDISINNSALNIHS